MAALDLLGRRWVLRIIWELRDGAVGARNLQRQCDGMSSSVLYQRLSELLDSGLVSKNGAGDYCLTKLGSELGVALAPLIDWSRDWEAVQNKNKNNKKKKKKTS